MAFVREYWRSRQQACGLLRSCMRRKPWMNSFNFSSTSGKRCHIGCYIRCGWHMGSLWEKPRLPVTWASTTWPTFGTLSQGGWLFTDSFLFSHQVPRSLGWPCFVHFPGSDCCIACEERLGWGHDSFRFCLPSRTPLHFSSWCAFPWQRLPMLTTIWESEMSRHLPTPLSCKSSAWECSAILICSSSKGWIQPTRWIMMTIFRFGSHRTLSQGLTMFGYMPCFTV